VFFEGVKVVLGMFGASVLNTKIDNKKRKENGLPLVVIESRGVHIGMVVGGTCKVL
jgi:hypothetical protein